MTDVIVLAVSRIGSGVCVAGVTGNGDWVRPTRPKSSDSWRQLEYDDCNDARGHWVMCKGHVVRMELTEHIPKDDHCEDWLIGDRKPELVGVLPEDEYRRLCQTTAENDLSAIEGVTAFRSLAMIRPDELRAFSFQHETSWEGVKKYIPRCDFVNAGCTYNGLGISDAEWRGYGRSLMEKRGSDCHIRAQDLFNQFGIRDCLLTLGRNQVAGKPYLLVIGVHLFPVQRFEMDFGRV